MNISTMFPRFETFTKISFLLLNFQFRTSYPSFPLPTFKLPTSILNFPLIFSLSFKFEACTKHSNSFRSSFLSIFYPRMVEKSRIRGFNSGLQLVERTRSGRTRRGEAGKVGMGNRSGPHARYRIPLDVRLHVPG